MSPAACQNKNDSMGHRLKPAAPVEDASLYTLEQTRAMADSLYFAALGTPAYAPLIL